MMNYCTRCGNKLREGARFCPKCGTEISASALAPAPIQQGYTPPPQSAYTAPPQQYAPVQPHPHAAPVYQSYVPHGAVPQKKKTGNALCVALAVLFVFQSVAVAAFGWPGFAVGKVLSAGSAPIHAVSVTAASVQVDPASDTVLSGSRTNGLELNIPAGTFGEATTVHVNDSDMDTPPADVSYLTEPFELSAENGGTVLGNDVTLRVELPNTVSASDRITVMGMYHDGNEWEYIFPDSAALEEGVLQFHTPHFSTFATAKLDRRKALTQYAEQAVLDDMAHGDDSEVRESTTDAVMKALDGLGITSPSVQREMAIYAIDQIPYADIVTNLATEDYGDVIGSVVQISVVKKLSEEYSESISDAWGARAGSTVSGLIAAVQELKTTGKWDEAGKSFLYSFMEINPLFKAGKTVKEMCDIGSQAWQDYSFKSAYKVFTNQNVSKDGRISEDSWTLVFMNMGNGFRRQAQEYYKLYAQTSGIPLSQITGDKALMARLDAVVEESIKKEMSSRWVREAPLREASAAAKAAYDAEVAKKLEIIDFFDRDGLLEDRIVNNVYKGRTMSQKISSLMSVRKIILGLVDGNMKAFGQFKSSQESNLGSAIREWLSYKPRDRHLFFEWMYARGYLKRQEGASGGSFPSFDELAGSYQDGKGTITAVEVNSFMMDLLEGIGAEVTAGDNVGSVFARSFSITKSGENKGTISFSDGSKGNVSYDPNTGSLSVSVSDTQGNGLKGVFACTYNEAKDRVAVSGPLTGDASGMAVVTLQIEGSKAIV